MLDLTCCHPEEQVKPEHQPEVFPVASTTQHLIAPATEHHIEPAARGNLEVIEPTHPLIEIHISAAPDTAEFTLNLTV